MRNFIIKRIFSGLLVILGILASGLWMISQIPGSYRDLSDLEPIENNVKEFSKAETSIPLFYFGVLSKLGRDKSLDLHWNGNQNLFHQTLSAYLKLDFGNSSIDGVPVGEKFAQAFPWSLAVQLPAILILLLLGVFLSIESSLRGDRLWVRLADNLLLVFTSVPGFWMATLLLFFFANTAYLKWFPSGMQAINNHNPFYCWIRYPQYFVLPIICLVLPSLAYLIRILKAGLKENMDSLHWTRVLSSGVSSRRALFVDALPQASIPFTVWMAGILPAIFSGSVVIEQIFSIPGLGRLMYISIYTRDWPVVQFLFFFTAVLTVLGFMVSDIIIRYLDPRIKINT